MAMEKEKIRLLQILREKSYQYRPDSPFKLASGRLSPYYIDCKPTTHNAEGMNLIGEIFYNLIEDLDVTAIGGLTMGADPIAHATSMFSFNQKKRINSFTVREKRKEHGTFKSIEGDIQRGERIVIIDDVITTGGSAIKAITGAKEAGLDIVKVIVLVDREEGGKEAIQEHVREFESVFTLSDLRGIADYEKSTSKRNEQGESRATYPGM